MVRQRALHDPPKLPLGSPGLKFLSRFASEHRSQALECVTLFGLNALLTAYSLEELTFEQLELVTERACRLSGHLLDKGSVRTPLTQTTPFGVASTKKRTSKRSAVKATVSSKAREEAATERHGVGVGNTIGAKGGVSGSQPHHQQQQQAQRQHGRSRFEADEANGAGESETAAVANATAQAAAAAAAEAARLRRPDVLKNWPFVDEEGDVTDVLMGNTSEHHREYKVELAHTSSRPHPNASSNASSLWRHGHRRGGAPNPAALSAARAKAKRAALAGGGGGLWEGAEAEEEEEERGGGTSVSEDGESKSSSNGLSFEVASVRERLKRVAQTADEFQDHRKRLSRFELVESLAALGLKTCFNELLLLLPPHLAPLPRGAFGLDHDNATHAAVAFLTEHQYRRVVNEVLLSRSLQPLPLPKLMQGARTNGQDTKAEYPRPWGSDNPVGDDDDDDDDDDGESDDNEEDTEGGAEEEDAEDGDGGDSERDNHDGFRFGGGGAGGGDGGADGANSGGGGGGGGGMFFVPLPYDEDSESSYEHRQTGGGCGGGGEGRPSHAAAITGLAAGRRLSKPQATDHSRFVGNSGTYGVAPPTHAFASSSSTTGHHASAAAAATTTTSATTTRAASAVKTATPSSVAAQRAKQQRLRKQPLAADPRSSGLPLSPLRGQGKGAVSAGGDCRTTNVPRYLRGVESKIKDQVSAEKAAKRRGTRAQAAAVAGVVVAQHEADPDAGYLRGGAHTRTTGPHTTNPSQAQALSAVPRGPEGKAHWEAIADAMLTSDLLTAGAANQLPPPPVLVQTNADAEPFSVEENRSPAAAAGNAGVGGSGGGGHTVTTEQLRSKYNRDAGQAFALPSGPTAVAAAAEAAAIKRQAKSKERDKRKQRRQPRTNHSGWVGDFGNMRGEGGGGTYGVGEGEEEGELGSFGGHDDEAYMNEPDEGTEENAGFVWSKKVLSGERVGGAAAAAAARGEFGEYEGASNDYTDDVSDHALPRETNETPYGMHGEEEETSTATFSASTATYASVLPPPPPPPPATFYPPLYAGRVGAIGTTSSSVAPVGDAMYAVSEEKSASDGSLIAPWVSPLLPRQQPPPPQESSSLSSTTQEVDNRGGSSGGGEGGGGVAVAAAADWVVVGGGSKEASTATATSELIRNSRLAREAAMNQVHDIVHAAGVVLHFPAPPPTPQQQQQQPETPSTAAAGAAVATSAGGAAAVATSAAAGTRAGAGAVSDEGGGLSPAAMSEVAVAASAVEAPMAGSHGSSSIGTQGSQGDAALLVGPLAAPKLATAVSAVATPMTSDSLGSGRGGSSSRSSQPKDGEAQTHEKEEVEATEE